MTIHGLMSMFSLSVSRYLTALVLFLLWLSVIYQFVLWRRRKAREKSGGPDESAGDAPESKP